MIFGVPRYRLFWKRFLLKYKENKIDSKTPASVELKDEQLYISDLSLSGNEQFNQNDSGSQ